MYSCETVGIARMGVVRDYSAKLYSGVFIGIEEIASGFSRG